MEFQLSPEEKYSILRQAAREQAAKSVAQPPPQPEVPMVATATVSDVELAEPKKETNGLWDWLGTDKGREQFAHIGDAISGAGAGTLGAADILYHAYTGKESPGKDQTAQAYKDVGQNVRKWLAEKKAMQDQANLEKKMAMQKDLADKRLLAEEERSARAQQNSDRNYKLRKDQVAAQIDANNIARGQKTAEQDRKIKEEQIALEVPGYGLARSGLDARKVREGLASKKKFDNLMDEMIGLRNKYGTEYWNDEAEARAKQLSKKALLEYKNMAKLGVLSKSDEDIINAVIPADPLGNDWSFFHDPIMTQLTELRADSDKDFKATVGSMMRGGEQLADSMPIYDGNNKSGKLLSDTAHAKDGGGRHEVGKRQYSAKANKTKIFYSDGSEEVVDGKQLRN